MATGMARGAHDRGKKIAFGDGKRIMWGPYSKAIFRGNPNIAWPGSERDKNIEWIHYYKGGNGTRIYNKQGPGHWIWNYDFRVTPGEFYFEQEELKFAENHGGGFIFIEPNVARKDNAPNKQWPFDRFAWVAEKLKADGYEIVQPIYSGANFRIACARPIYSVDLRHAAAVLARAALYIGPEGGLHHAAAAVGTVGVVIFGGFIPPAVTGYVAELHTNIAGSDRFCGSFKACPHCKQAMEAIDAEHVYRAAKQRLGAVEI